MAVDGLFYAYNAGMDNGDYLFVIVELDSMGLLSRMKHRFKWFSSPHRKKKEHFLALEKMFQHSLILAQKFGDSKSQARYEDYTKQLKCHKSDLPFYSGYYQLFSKVGFSGLCNLLLRIVAEHAENSCQKCRNFQTIKEEAKFISLRAE